MKKNNPKSNALKLRKIFNKADPQGIFFGDNPDEYDAEIRAILKIFPECDSAAKLKNALWSIFKDQFTPSIAGPESDYEELSKLLFDWKKKYYD